MDRVGQHLGIALVQRSGEPPAEIASLWPSLTKLDAPHVACAMAADGVPNRIPLEVPPHTRPHPIPQENHQQNSAVSEVSR